MSRESGLVIVQISGDLDAHGTKQIEPALSVAIAERTSNTVIDLSAVTFLSSAALAMLAATAHALRRGGGSMTIAGASGIVAEVIRQSGFGDLLPNYPTLDEAIVALEGGE